jgi:hypothetical protein
MQPPEKTSPNATCSSTTFGDGLEEVLLHNSLGVVPHTAVVGSQLALPLVGSQLGLLQVDSPVGFQGDMLRFGTGSQAWGFAVAAT